MYFVYILKCIDNSFYIGVSSNAEKRFDYHKNSKGGRYTRLHKPTKFLYTEKFASKKEALKREHQIKRWRREKKENLIKYGKPQGSV